MKVKCGSSKKCFLFTFLQPPDLCLFEFKYNNSLKEAMDQIYSRDYARRFALEPRTVYIIATNFNEQKDTRGLEYE